MSSGAAESKRRERGETRDGKRRRRRKMGTWDE